MASIDVKCPNCGANLKIDTEKSMKFCPFCGGEFPKEEGFYDFKKYELKHQEAVDKHDDKVTTRLLLGMLIFAIILLLSAYIPDKIEASRLNALIAEVQTDIVEGRLDEAEVKVLQIPSDKDEWNQKREDLQKIIQERKKR